MKKILWSLISLMPFFTNAQSPSEFPTDQNGRLYYYERIQIDSISKSQLYLNSKAVFLNAFKPSNFQIQQNDQNLSSIIGIGFNDIDFIFRGLNIKQQMWFTIKIHCSDGSYDLHIYDIFCRSYPNSNATSEPSFEKFPSYSNAMNKKIHDIIRTVKSTMSIRVLTQDIPFDSKKI